MNPAPHLEIRSGGQTGVDRAALDAAMDAGVRCGGWCPAGRRAEDGSIPARYPLDETQSCDYAERTRLNVRDSDATLIITRGPPTGGAAMTEDFAHEMGRGLKIVDLSAAGFDPDRGADDIAGWIAACGVSILNVAGPRESTLPGIYRAARPVLDRVCARLADAA
ncbi:MAG: putative molybdenum carrier protein [Rhodospirillales bacterium]|nr:putative molybdenum carrier protein [Rhodospirillales bacterium]MDP6805643.1 putative molybdenum carrier protein [Rhodospirillales bacterium]